VRLRLDQKIPDLRSGLTADVNLVIERRAQAITVARSAILGRDGDARVLIVKDGVVNPASVKFVEWPSERVIVLSGLAPGAQLLAAPRPDLIGKRVAPTKDLALVAGGPRPRGSDARKAL
jgi:hypothetical protein